MRFTPACLTTVAPSSSLAASARRMTSGCRCERQAVDRLLALPGLLRRRLAGGIDRRRSFFAAAHLEARRFDGVSRAVVHEITVRRRPLDDRRERIRFLVRVHRHYVGRESGAERAPDALLPVDRDLHRPAGEDADAPGDAFLVM